MHDAASCRHAGDDCRLSTPPHHYIATKKRGWDTGREEDSYAAPETFGRVVRARLADIFERGDCDEEGTQTPEEEEETSNSHRKDDMETLGMDLGNGCGRNFGQIVVLTSTLWGCSGCVSGPDGSRSCGGGWNLLPVLSNDRGTKNLAVLPLHQGSLHFLLAIL